MKGANSDEEGKRTGRTTRVQRTTLTCSRLTCTGTPANCKTGVLAKRQRWEKQEAVVNTKSAQLDAQKVHVFDCRAQIAERGNASTVLPRLRMSMPAHRLMSEDLLCILMHCVVNNYHDMLDEMLATRSLPSRRNAGSITLAQTIQ